MPSESEQMTSYEPSTFQSTLSQVAMAIEIDRPVFIWGPPGIGKSALGRLIAERLKLNYIDIRMSLLNPVDLRGIPMADAEAQVAKWLKPAFIPSEEGNLINFDELNVAPPTVQAAAYQFILDRKCGDHELPPRTFIIACGNRAEDQAVVFSMPAPLRNRFIHINMRSHLEDWILWAEEMKIHSAIIGYLQQNPQNLFQFDARTHVQNFPSPRSWEYCSDIIKKACGSHTQVDMEKILPFEPLINGCLGKGTAIEFLAFLAVADKIPDVRSILFDGKKPKCPKDPSATFALSSSMVAIINEEFPNLKKSEQVTYLTNAVEYATKMEQREWAVHLSRSIGRTKFWQDPDNMKSLAQTEIIIEWSDLVGEATGV